MAQRLSASRLSQWWDSRRGGRAIAISWLVSRALMLALLALKAERYIVGDVGYYWRKIAGLSAAGLPNTLNEYPTPVTWLLWIPYGLTGGNRSAYFVLFIVFMLALDAGFTWALWRVAGRRHDRAVDFWLSFVFLMGPICYFRFDLLPAVLAGGALLAARRRPWITGALTGLGAAVKLWPALLIGSFLSHKPDRRGASLGFVAVGFGLALVSLLAGGWARLVSPLTWQSDRGLQIESIWATPLMVARAVSPSRWAVAMSRYQAYEVFGPGVHPLLLLSTVATVLGLAVIVALYFRAFRAARSTPVAVGLAILSTVAIMTITNKTLSPQYLLWMGGPMAALILLRSQATAAERSAIFRFAGQLLVLALLTQLVYPLLYNGLLGRWGHAGIVLSSLLTALRNLALVAFTVEVCGLAWRHLSPVRATPDPRS